MCSLNTATSWGQIQHIVSYLVKFRVFVYEGYSVKYYVYSTQYSLVIHNSQAKLCIIYGLGVTIHHPLSEECFTTTDQSKGVMQGLELYKPC